MGALLSFSQHDDSKEDLIQQPPSDRLNVIIYNRNDIVADGGMSFKYHPNQSDEITIRFTTISDVSQVHVVSASGKMPHFGLIFRNTFIVSTHPSNRYQYLLCHALPQTDNKSKLKLDIIITNNLNIAKYRLAKLVRKTAQDVISTEWQKVSRTATMQKIVTAFHKIVDKSFEIHAAKQMVLQHYDEKINCILAARYFYAVLMNIDPDKCIEDWINEHRGILSQEANINVADTQIHIPCKGGQVFWHLLDEKHTLDGVYRLQKRKTDEEIKSENEEFVEHAVVHKFQYRIIFQAEGQKNEHGGYNWRDIDRTNDEKEARQLYQNKFQANQVVDEFKPQRIPMPFESKSLCKKCGNHHERSLNRCHRVHCAKCSIYWCNLCGEVLEDDDQWKSHFKPPNKCVLYSKIKK